MSQRAKIWKERVTYVLFSPYRLFKFICFAIGFVNILVLLIAGIFFKSVLNSVPDINKLQFSEAKAIANRVVQRKLEDKTKGHHWTDIKEINRDFLYTVVLSEDSNFFEHEGIDLDAIIWSLTENLRKQKYEYGASTITQQVVKNLFLTNEKSIVRKIKEIIITERLEKHFSKNQILELYLNVAELGPDIFGVHEASRHYFGKVPAEINAAEGAFIALMLPSPRKYYYAIYQNRNLAPTKSRKIRRVLGDMLANEYISTEQYRKYLKYDYFRKR